MREWCGVKVCVWLLVVSHQQRVVDRSLAARALRPRREANAATHTQPQHNTTQRRSRSKHLLQQLNCLESWHSGFGVYLITGPFHRCAISSLAVGVLNNNHNDTSTNNTNSNTNTDTDNSEL
jgi:hypothetical protein